MKSGAKSLSTDFMLSLYQCASRDSWEMATYELIMTGYRIRFTHLILQDGEGVGRSTKLFGV